MRWFHFLWILGLAVAVRGQTPSPSAHPFFKALEGRWTGDGELITRDQGELKIHEEWTGAPEDGGGFGCQARGGWGGEPRVLLAVSPESDERALRVRIPAHRDGAGDAVRGLGHRKPGRIEGSPRRSGSETAYHEHARRGRDPGYRAAPRCQWRRGEFRQGASPAGAVTWRRRIVDGCKFRGAGLKGGP